MSASDNLERLVAEWLTASAPTSIPGDAHGDLMTAVRGSRQRPRWLATARVRATGGAEALRFAGSAVFVLATIALLVLVLLAIALAGGSHQRLPPPFGPAGNGLMAFNSGGAIYTTDAAGTVSVRVPRDGADHVKPNWSPNGKQIAYWSISPNDGVQLNVLTSDAGTSLDIPVDPAIEPNTGLAPQWSPDSRSLAFAASTPDGSRLEIADLPTSTIRELRLDGLDARNPIWSPDGQWIAFYAVETDTLEIRYHVVHPDGSGARRLPTSAIDLWTYADAFRWSPDPGSPVLLYGVGGNIALMDVTTGREVVVSAEDASEFGPTWSPDGRHVAWYYSTADENEIRVADIGPGPTVGGIRSILTAAPPAEGVDAGDTCTDWPSLAGRFICQRPEWSPDGQHIYAVDVLGTQILVISTDGAGSIRGIPVPETGPVSWQRIAP